jgi:hypothetical protein
MIMEGSVGDKTCKNVSSLETKEDRNLAIESMSRGQTSGVLPFLERGVVHSKS